MQQSKPSSKKYNVLICEIEDGSIKIPQFQRDFVWEMDKTAKLLDSIVKGYPIGTFILWETTERMNAIKNIGNQDLPEPKENYPIQYVLDGQQRMTSLYVAYKGLCLCTDKSEKNYKNIYVDLDCDDIYDEDPIVTERKPEGNSIKIHELLDNQSCRDIRKKYSDDKLDKIDTYRKAFTNYDFSTIELRDKKIETVIEVFTRINTSGTVLTLFEIMSAKTYDESKNFDMQVKWCNFEKEIQHYGKINNSVILNLLSLLLDKDCKRSTILKLKKDDIINIWDKSIDSIKESIDYLKRYGAVVSRILPYDSLLVPFAYFFYKFKQSDMNEDQRLYLQQFFWRMSLSYRYRSATESKLTQDITTIESVIQKQDPIYEKYDMNLQLESNHLKSMRFSTGNSYCKAIICLLAQNNPLNFHDNSKVVLNNDWLKQSNSKNYHHFYPRDYLKKTNQENDNNVVNITIVCERMNKGKISNKPPFKYLQEFKKNNSNIEKSLKSQFIEWNDVIKNDEEVSYEDFLMKRAERMSDELKKLTGL